MASGAKLRLVVVSLLSTTCSDRAQEERVCEDGESLLASDRCNECRCEGGIFWIRDDVCAVAYVGGGESLGCVGPGVADVDPDSPGLQVECIAVAEKDRAGGGIDNYEPQQCVASPTGLTWPADDIDLCYIVRTEDVSAPCIELGGPSYAVEVEVLRRPGTAAEEHVLRLTCAAPEPTCPGWGVEDD